MDGMAYFESFPFANGTSETSGSESSLDFLLPEEELNCMSPLLKKEDSSLMAELLLHGANANANNNGTGSARNSTTQKPKSKTKAAAEAKRARAMKRDAEAKRRHSHTSKEPTRDEFPDEASYIETWRKWRQIRDNNNAAVKKSRENLKKKKMETETLCEKREKQHAGLEYEISLLREHVQLLVRAVRDAPSLDDSERKKVQILCYEETALVA